MAAGDGRIHLRPMARHEPSGFHLKLAREYPERPFSATNHADSNG